ncbi:hypothetical protein [Emticicia sp. BO119]|uniref:hypothetical protein n=1 Tax=Emticicia sp. BO119 TaxID=2757768 RepID=UPI0015F01E1B|nr:hypothetical protein [Emticicia sp. BO119]MBA4852643.1 hypothetical protein [Emticicia sp. BO119]
MKNTLKTLFINKIIISGFIFLFSSTMSFADKGALSKSHVDSLKKSEEKLWYVDKFKSEKKTIPKKIPTQQPKIGNLSKIFEIIASVFQVLVWVIIGLAILGACYLLIKNLKGFRFKTNPEIRVTTSEMLTGESDIKAVNVVDLSSQIEKCILDKNYRLATRYYYLWVMKMLNESHLIEFNIDKTNQDYTRELSKRDIFSKERLGLFIECTNYYEYLWFGNFAVSEPAFLKIEKTFKDFLTKKA